MRAMLVVISIIALLVLSGRRAFVFKSSRSAELTPSSLAQGCYNGPRWPTELMTQYFKNLIELSPKSYLSVMNASVLNSSVRLKVYDPQFHETPINNKLESQFSIVHVPFCSKPKS